MGRKKLGDAAKSNILRVRLTPADRARVDALSAVAEVEPSSWARDAILREVERQEASAAVSRKKVAKRK